ncbi:hypothetical protein F444_21290 [Phytophthora nicotianae P1976]|uniref:Tf2-1-like SH3-like domain-containing protein n=1 Tax=Phytophthora nicotianae P1976 TaxID=1317066 RepID=A0A080Z1M4_PHYNI|nr:hypothetical protein F444_21290 [Phytophthora nicotianae P1976]
MAQYYNQNRRPQVFTVGDEVLLFGVNLAEKHLGTTKRKRGPRWIGPYGVTKTIGGGYYQLALPPKLRLHPVFHTSLIKPYIAADHRRGFLRCACLMGRKGNLSKISSITKEKKRWFRKSSGSASKTRHGNRKKIYGPFKA